MRQPPRILNGSAITTPSPIPGLDLLLRHRPAQPLDLLRGDGEIPPVGAELVPEHAIASQIQNQRIEPTALRTCGVGIASAVEKKDASAVPVAQLDVTVRVEPGEVLEPRTIEPNEIGLGQGHPRIHATGMAPVTGAGVVHRSHQAAIGHLPAHKTYSGRSSKIGNSPTASYHGARESQ